VGERAETAQIQTLSEAAPRLLSQRCPMLRLSRWFLRPLWAALALTSGPALSAQPAPEGKAQPPQPPAYMSSPLKSVPALQVRITCSIPQPTVLQIITLLRERTGLRLVLDPSINTSQPALGSLTGVNVPAWILMEQLAHSKIVQGTWQRHDGGYRLVSHASPAPGAQNATRPEDNSLFTSDVPAYLAGGIMLFAALAMFIWCLRQRHDLSKGRKNSKPPAPLAGQVPEQPRA
jgi:hypothetical protein